MKTLIVIIAGFLFTTTAFSQNVDLGQLQKNNVGLYMKDSALYTGKIYKKHENGNIGLVGEIKDGKKAGTWVYFYSTGEKKRESIYINNLKEGLTYYWYKNGIMAKEIMYRDGKNIDQKLWDEKGDRKPNPTFESFR
jgi:antitoxin component YwqK of YwqJK toxin-antitoxin module